MATRRRASERARALTGIRPVSRARRPLSLTLVLAVAGALGGCRETVILDPGANGDGDGGAPTGSAGSGGGPGPGIDGGLGGFKFDGGRLDALGNLCPGGPIKVLEFTQRTPDWIISVDRSVWMQSWWGAGTRLETVEQQVHTLVQGYDRGVHFGYQEFPSTSNMCGNGQGCCAGMVTAPAQKNRNAIDNVLHACDNGSAGCAQAQRPAADALAKVNRTYTQFSSGSPGRKRYVILILGGDPTCNLLGNGEPGSGPCDATVTEVTKLNAAGIFTIVFGVGDEAATSACLSQLATAGGLENSFHLEPTPNAFSEKIVETVATMATDACHLDLLTPPADTKSVNLVFDNDLVPPSSTDGWDFDQGSPLKITVHGHWCDTLLRTSQVELFSGCIPPRH